MGVAITSGVRDTAHTITLIVDGVIIGALCIYVTYKGRQRDPYPPSFWKKWGPTILAWISFPFIMADPVRHVLNDNNTWAGCSRTCGELWPSSCEWTTSNEYRCALRYGELFEPQYGFNATNGTAHGECLECWVPETNQTEVGDCLDYYPTTCVHDDQETMDHLSSIGILFTIVFTYLGFAIFIWANLWNANIIEKCRDIRHKYRVLRGLSDSDEY